MRLKTNLGEAVVFVPPGPPADERGGSPAGGGGGGDYRRGRPVPLPAGFAELPAGAELAYALEEVPLALVSGHDTVEVVKAAHRQACRARALFLLAVLESGLRRSGSADTVDRDETPGEFASDEARAALAWSRRRADRAFNLAWDVFARFPMLGEAMMAGDLDEPRAVAFTTWTAGLTEEQAALICSRLVGQAPQLMVGELIEHITRMAIEIDPEWAERRYRNGVRRRRVVGTRNDDGTASVAGLDLPLDRAAAACDHIDELARACKRAGDRRKINHIRADLFLGLLDGTFETMAEDEIITYILAHADADQPSDTSPGAAPDGAESGGTEPGGSGDDGPDGGSGDDGPDGGSGGDDSPGRPGCDSSGDGQPGGGASGDDAPDVPSAGDLMPTPSQPNVSSQPRGDGDPADPTAGEADQASGAAPGPPRRRTRWALREIRAQLATLLGLNSQPAHVPGWGYVPAAIAREVVADMAHGEWRYVICNAVGNPIDAGLIRARPGSATNRPPRDRRRGGIVELHVSERELQNFRAGAAKADGWADVLGEIVRQYQPAAGSNGDPGGRAGRAANPRRRTAGARLRRWVFVRDRSCVHPACRVPAARTDQDHAIDHARGGLTDHENLGSCCRHDHRLQHDGGWQVSKPDPYTTVWRSALGHLYVSRPPPVIPHPTPPLPRPPLPDPEPGTVFPWSRPVTHPCGCEGMCECEPTLPPELTPSDAGQCQEPPGETDDVPPF